MTYDVCVCIDGKINKEDLEEVDVTQLSSEVLYCSLRQYSHVTPSGHSDILGWGAWCEG